MLSGHPGVLSRVPGHLNRQTFLLCRHPGASGCHGSSHPWPQARARHHVERAHATIDVQEVKTISVDEVAKRRGHDYLTVVSEPGEGKTRRSRVL